MSRVFFIFLTGFLPFLLFGCINTTEWNSYKPIYFENKEDSISFSKFLDSKNIENYTLEKISLDFTNFPSLEPKTWNEIQEMAQEDPRRDNDFINKIPSFFQVGENFLVYVPINLSYAKINKYSKLTNIPLLLEPQNFNVLKKVLYSTSFLIMGIFWIFLRKPQAFFTLFALILGLTFLQVSPFLFYPLIILFLSYTTLLDNWSRHFLSFRKQNDAIYKTFKKVTLSQLIFFFSYISFTIIWKNHFTEVFLISLYFFLLLCSFFIWIYWVYSRNETQVYISFFPSNIVNKTPYTYTAKGFLYIGNLFLAITPFLIITIMNSYQEKEENNFIYPKEAVYSEIDQTSLLILDNTPSNFINLANYLDHQFYQEALMYDSSLIEKKPKSDYAKKQLIYSWDNTEITGVEEITIFEINDQKVLEEIKNLKGFWKILLSPNKKLITFQIGKEDKVDPFSGIERSSLLTSFIFLFLFSLKIKSYFRMMNTV